MSSSAIATAPRSRGSSTAWSRSRNGGPGPNSRPGPGRPCGAAWPASHRVGSENTGSPGKGGRRMGEPEHDDHSAGLDTSVPHIARVYDYWLGGKDNYAADRKAAEQVIATFPDVTVSVRAQRAFLGRAVHYLAAEAGIRQFLDIGTGLPSANNTHEVAQQVAPQTRIVYVDNDPVVLL